MDTISLIKIKKEYEISKELFKLLNDSILFRILFFGNVIKNLSFNGDNMNPTKIGINDLLSEPEIRFDMNPRDEYYLNMKDVYVSIFSIGDFDKMYQDVINMPYDNRILPATLKLGNQLFITDYEDCIYYDYLFDHHYEKDVIERMYSELPFYKFDGDSCYNPYIHKIRVSFIIETIKSCFYYSYKKYELEKILKLYNLILEKYPEYRLEEANIIKNEINFQMKLQ